MDDSKPGHPDTASYMGATPEAPDTNTNLGENTPGGPQTGADRAATRTIEDQHAGRETDVPDPTRQMDNSGMLSPTGEGHDADIIGASGDDRNENR